MTNQAMPVTAQAETVASHLPSFMEPTFLDGGGLAVDDRGEVGFVNGFDFQGVKRFYMLENHQVGFIRAWHAHRREAKYVLVVAGAALVAAVKIEGDWAKPSQATPVFRKVMSTKKPSVLYIPPGYANGAMSMTKDAKIVYFSTATIAETHDDDVRYDARYWDVWNVEER
jgi:dTDP-4-dehydrorhamnose 3,5-epimerase-like enzyme